MLAILVSTFSGEVQSDFTELLVGPSSPDFSANGAPITFGYLTNNSAPSPPAMGEDFFATSGVDNWEVTVVAEGILFLDFGTQVDIDFVASQGWAQDANQQWVMVNRFSTQPGSEPPMIFSQDEQDRLVAAVQTIFSDSGINLAVVAGPPDGESASVRFAPCIVEPVFQGGTLLGRAYDGALPGVSGIDRFNERKDGKAAVFAGPACNAIPPAPDPPVRVAGTVAHEAAHLFGARHINLLVGNTVEVMDYERSATLSPMFAPSPSLIREPPTDSAIMMGLNRDTTGCEHNPQYHIRRWVLDESDSTLQGEGLVPGTWDQEFSACSFAVLLEIFLDSSSTTLNDLSLAAPTVQGPSVGFGEELVVDAVADSISVGQGAAVIASTNLSGVNLVAASSPGGPFDVVFGFGDPTTGVDVDLDLSSLAASTPLNVFFIDATGALSIVGTATILVPEPDFRTALVLGLLCLSGFYNQRRRRRWSDDFTTDCVG